MKCVRLNLEEIFDQADLNFVTECHINRSQMSHLEYTFS
jgi:hypothetical protein